MSDRPVTDQSVSGGSTHQAVWELLPWSVNGTLEAGEMRLVDSHLESCAICRRELAAQQRLGAALADADDFGAAESRNWEVLRQRIRTESGGRTPGSGGLRAFLGLLDHTVQSFWKWPVAAAVACLALFAVIGWPALDRQGEYRTLTSPAAVEGPVVRIKVAQGVDSERLGSLLAPLDLEIVSGPSPTGVYSARARGSRALEEAAAALAAMDEIEFAAVRTGQ